MEVDASNVSYIFPSSYNLSHLFTFFGFSHKADRVLKFEVLSIFSLICVDSSHSTSESRYYFPKKNLIEKMSFVFVCLKNCGLHNCFICDFYSVDFFTFHYKIYITVGSIGRVRLALLI